MNFLFFTTMMVLIFTLVSTTMTKNLRTTVFLARNLEAQISDDYTLKNSIEAKAYHATKKYEKKDDQKRKEERKEKKYTPRSNSSGENSKLNLYPLITSSLSYEEEKLITLTLKRLLKTLYQNETFYKKTSSKHSQILNTFLKEFLKGLKKEKSLAKVTFSESYLREFYLQMCNGTNSKKSISLLNFITVQEVNDGPFIVFPRLSKELVYALFDQKIAKRIEEEEKHLYYEGRATPRLSQNELEKLLKNTKYDLHKKLLAYKNLRFKNIQKFKATSKGNLIIVGPPAPQEQEPLAGIDA